MSEIKSLNLIPKNKVEYVIIAVCTYQRADKLERLLESLCRLDYPDCKTDILIVDNDTEKSAKTVYEKFENKLNILYTTEEKKGFSNVRNCALAKAIELEATHLAFIDDDEIADKNCLINHINFYNNFENIYISSGPTYKKFEKDYPDYIVNNCTFKVISHKELGKAKKTCASGNVFFPLNIIKDNDIYFDTRFNNTGSEDSDFFGRLNDAGYTIGWNYNAVNFEIVQSERANIKWILRRAFNTGYSISKINRKTISKIKLYLYILEKFIIIIIETILVPLSLFAGLTVFFNRITNLFKNIGKFTGIIIN